MNLEIVIKTGKDGKVVLSCPRLPGCEAEGASLQEATAKFIDMIAESMSSELKLNIKKFLTEAFKTLPENIPADSSAVFTNFPICLN